jgi:hypothetical protein
MEGCTFLSSQKSEGMGLNFERYLKDTVRLGSKSHPVFGELKVKQPIRGTF